MQSRSRAAKPGVRGKDDIYETEKIWAYLDGKRLVEAIQAALDNNMTVTDMKDLLIKENPGYEVTFKVV